MSDRCPHNIPKGQCPDPTCPFSVTLEAYLAKIDDDERKELLRVLRSRYCIHCGWRRPTPTQQVNAYILQSTVTLEAYLAKVDDDERKALFRALRSRYCIRCGWKRPPPSDCCERCG